MGDRIHVSPRELREAAARLRALDAALDELHDLDVDAAALGDAAVADGVVEVQRGWHLQRASVRQHLATLAIFVDAAADAARDADATVVTGRAP